MARNIEGDNPLIFYERGSTHFHLGDYPEALIDLNCSNRLLFKDETISLIDDTMEKLRDKWAEDHPEPGDSPLPNELFSQCTQGVDILTLSLVCKEWTQLVYVLKMQGPNKHSIDWKNAFVVSVIAWIRDERLYEDILLDDRVDIEISTEEEDNFEAIVYSRYWKALKKSIRTNNTTILKRLLKIKLKVDSEERPVKKVYKKENLYNVALRYAVKLNNEEAEDLVSQVEQLDLEAIFGIDDDIDSSHFLPSLLQKNKVNLIQMLWQKYMDSLNYGQLQTHMIYLADLAFKTNCCKIVEWVLDQHPQEVHKNVIFIHAAYFGCSEFLYWWREQYRELSDITYETAKSVAMDGHEDYRDQSCVHGMFVNIMNELFPNRVPSNSDDDVIYEPFLARDPCF